MLCGFGRGTAREISRVPLGLQNRRAVTRSSLAGAARAAQAAQPVKPVSLSIISANRPMYPPQFFHGIVVRDFQFTGTARQEQISVVRLIEHSVVTPNAIEHCVRALPGAD